MFEFKTEDPFITSLACAALNPALRSILVFDAPYPVLQDIAEILAQMLKAATGQQVEQGNIGTEQDDDVWGSISFPGSEGDAVTPIFKLFSRERNADNIQLLAIADLARLSLAMARTCTMLVGADIAYLERNGEHDQWPLQQCWLASCSRQEVGAISPHLLDRFAIRLSWQPGATDMRQIKIDNLRTSIHDQFIHSTQLPIELLQRITDAVQRQADFTSTAFLRMMDYIPTEPYYPRRELALARFAQSLARLHSNAQVTPEYVDQAAAMLSFVTAKTSGEDKLLSPESMQVQAPVEQERTVQPISNIQPIQTTIQQEASGKLTAKIQEPITSEALVVSNLVPDGYPEDKALVEREAASLKVPFARFSTARSDRGSIFGVEQSDTLEDLAIVSTLQTAAMFQRVRNLEQQREKRRFLIEKSDLRRYRRGYVSEHMLLLLLDYTCLQHCDWQEALLPYLQEAYADRASMSIVKVGAADASDPWQAEIVSGRNILVPRIEMALEAQRGTSTPLAHGLELALQTLHRVLQQGRSAVQHVILVVISDGRGNIPLEASLKKKTQAIVTREGIDDALRIAQVIREMKRVESVVLNPQPRNYAQLPGLLAQALGAAIENIPPRPDGSEGG